MSVSPAGDLRSAGTGRPVLVCRAQRGPTVGVAPPTARAEQDLVDQGYGEAGRDFLAETQLPEDVTAVVTNPPDGRRLFEFVDRALELTRLVGGTVAILINTQWQTGAANSIRLRHPAFQASVMLTNRIAWSRTPGLARLMFAGKDAETEPEARCCIVCLPYAASVHGSYRLPGLFDNMPATRQAPRHG
jgi:hypothetical protein